MNKDKPCIVISKCLGFENCRYNGAIENDEFIKKLGEHVEYITVCPEVEIGLTTPREPIRIVNKEGELRLLQPKTGKDFSNHINEFSEEFLTNLKEVDGFILKSRSPSCGIKEVKIYSSEEKGASSSKGVGFFASAVKNRYDNIPIEDEGRLKDFKIREHFLTKLFLLREFRDIKSKKSLTKLVEYHSNNKLLFMAYSQKYLKELGSILGNAKNSNLDEVFILYEDVLLKLFSKAPKYTSNANVLLRAMGYFSDELSKKEKEFIIETIEKYKEGHIPFSVPLYVVKTYAMRFNIENLINQTFFNPYPDDLNDVRDSGKLVR